MRQALVARWLDQPGEVDDDVRAGEKRRAVVARNIGGTPARALVARRGKPARDRNDVLDGIGVGQDVEHARADIAARARDHDSHDR